MRDSCITKMLILSKYFFQTISNITQKIITSMQSMCIKFWKMKTFRHIGKYYNFSAGNCTCVSSANRQVWKKSLFSSGIIDPVTIRLYTRCTTPMRQTSRGCSPLPVCTLTWKRGWGFCTDSTTRVLDPTLSSSLSLCFPRRLCSFLPARFRTTRGIRRLSGNFHHH